jgi:hypothetical protein
MDSNPPNDVDVKDGFVHSIEDAGQLTAMTNLCPPMILCIPPLISSNLSTCYSSNQYYTLNIIYYKL